MSTTKIDVTPEQVEAYLHQLQELLTEEAYTAYGISTVLNKILTANGREAIRPQMMYGYARNGLIVAGEKVTGKTLRTFTNGEVAQFLIRYCVRNNIQITVTPISV